MRVFFKRYVALLFLLGFSLCNSANALTGHFAISGNVGGAFWQQSQINFYEVIPAFGPQPYGPFTYNTPRTASIVGGLGLGYDLAFDSKPGTATAGLHDLLFSLDVSHPFSADTSGASSTVADPFPTSFSSQETNFLFNTKLTFQPVIAHLAPYIVAGVGVSLYRLKYQIDSDNGIGYGAGTMAHSGASLAYDVGAGLSYLFDPQFRVSLGYLMTNLGTQNTGDNLNWSAQPANSNEVITNAPLKVHTVLNEVLLGFDWFL